jgi:ABC-type glycerol-3-phosphate transport system permease component
LKSRGGLDTAERVLGGPVLWAGLAGLTAFAMAPFVWVLLASFKTRVELYAMPLVWLPASLSVANYVDAWTSKLTPFSRFFANSLWVSSVTMVATTAISVLAGYALARFRFAGRQTVMMVFLATQMFPAVLLIAPLLSQWHALGLIDTYQALIYSNFSFTVPFTVWMLVGYFESIRASWRSRRSWTAAGASARSAASSCPWPRRAWRPPRSSRSCRRGASCCSPSRSRRRPRCARCQRGSCSW